MAFLSGRFKDIERDLERRMYFNAGERHYEQATIERNRLQAVRALLERQRVATEGAGSYDAVAVAAEGTEANAQVFQVRDGVLSDRQSFYLDNQAEQGLAMVAEEFLLQYYASALSIPALIVVQGALSEGSELGVLGEILAERRGGPVEIRASERGGKRRILELAERNARLALDQEKLKAERRRQQRVESLAGLQRALGLDSLPVRIECFDVSHLGGTHTTSSMVVFEGGAPKKSDYRRFNIREVDPGDDYGAMAEVLSRRYAQWERQDERSPYDADRDQSFAALPNLVVIDGGKGQLGAGLEALRGFRERGVAVVSLAKRIEEVFLPGRRRARRARARHAGAPAAPARPRRGPPLRRHAPPDPARQGDDRVDHGRAPGHRAGAQAHAAQALRLARGGPRGLARGARARPRLPAEGRPRPLRPPQQDRPMTAVRPIGDTPPMSANGARSHLTDFVVISGLSGAGKSSAMNVFEDAGYFCVDNLPAEMIRSLAELFRHPGSKVERAAVVSDSRGGEYLSALAGVLDELTEAGVAHRVVFLLADEQTLLNRYKETRRRHPLAPQGSVGDGIRRELELLEPVKQRADLCIDTSGLSPAGLRRKVADELLEPSTTGKLAVTFTSFGHKHGPQRDADLAFDVRFLPNPHYEAELRPLTGFDQRIVDYVGRDGRLEEFYERIIPLLEYLLPQYVQEGKAHLVVAIGCTGGRHRSVTIAEHLAAHFTDAPDYFVEVQHRDVDRVPAR